MAASTTTKLKDIFVSYGREPAVIQFVKQLKQDLEMNGFTLWLDVEDIRSGTDWRAEIGSGLDNSKCIIPIITQKYLGSRYCVSELYTADGDQKHIFPIMFEDVDFNVSDTAKGVKFVISSINWTMCRPGVDDYPRSLEKLISSMRDQGIGVHPLPKQEVEESAPSEELKQLSLATPTSKGPPLRPMSTKPIKTLLDFKNPNGVAVTHDGKLVVTNMGTNEVFVFDENYERIGTIGSEGPNKGQFFCPQGVVVDHNNHVIITAYTLHCVQKFTVDGQFLQAAGTPGSEKFQFSGPNGVAVDKNGKIYVCDLGNGRVQILSNDMTFLGDFSIADQEYGSGRLNNPSGIAINSDGNIFVADMGNHCIQVFNPEGQFLSRIGKQGHLAGCITSPMALTIDSDDMIYVAEGSCRISTFTKHGIFVRCFGSYGAELGKFTTPRGICFDQEEKLYVCEWQNNRVQIFK